jgi:V-type H+-transporting ATPase subunit H
MTSIRLLDHDERIPLFTRAVESDPELPYAPLLRYVLISCLASISSFPRTLETQDDFVQLKAAQILTVLLWFVNIL